MHPIRVFIASSFELLTTRWFVGNLIRQLNDEFRPLGFPIQMLCWEDYEPAYVNDAGKQEEYNADLVIPCDIFIGLFWQRCGRYTQKEVQVAKENLSPDNIHLCLDVSGNRSPELDTFIQNNIINIRYDSLETLGDYITSVIRSFISQHPERKTICPNVDNSKYYGIGSSLEMKSLIGNEIRYASDIGERIFGTQLKLYPFNTIKNIPDSEIAICALEDTVAPMEKDEIRLSKKYVDKKCSRLNKINILVKNDLEKEFLDELQSWKHFCPTFQNYTEVATMVRLYLITSLLADRDNSLWRLTQTNQPGLDNQDIILNVIGQKAYIGEFYLLNLNHLPAYVNSQQFKRLKDSNADALKWRIFGLNVINIYCELMQMERESTSSKLKSATELFWMGDITGALKEIQNLKAALQSLDSIAEELGAMERYKDGLLNKLILLIDTYKASAMMHLAQGDFSEYMKDSYDVISAYRQLIKYKQEYITEFSKFEYRFAIELQECSHYEEALPLLMEVHSYLSHIDNEEFKFAVTLGLANTYGQGGYFIEAEELYLQLLDSGKTIVLENMATLYLTFNKQEKALPLLEKIVESTKNDQTLDEFTRGITLLDAYFEIGDCFSMSHRHNDAIAYYKMALEEAKRIRPKSEKEKNTYFEHLFFMYNGIGNFYSDELMAYDKAIEMYERAAAARLHLRRLSKVQRFDEESMLNHNMALAYYRKNELQSACEYNKKAEEGRRFLYQEDGSIHSGMELSRTLTNFAEVLKCDNKFEEALEKVNEAERILNEIFTGQPDNIVFEQTIPTRFLKANIMMLQGGELKEEGIKTMTSLLEWANSNPDFHYSPTIISECENYGISTP